jgi:PKD repeat protein
LGRRAGFLKLIYIFLFLFLFIFFCGHASALDWVHGYQTRIPVNVSGNDSWSTNQSYYPILLTLNNSNGISSSTNIYLNGTSKFFPNDINVTTGDSNTSLPFWIQPDTVTNDRAKIWINVSNVNKSANTTIYIYTNKNNYTYRSNISSTFDMGDTFGGDTLIADSANPVFTYPNPSLNPAIETSLLMDPNNSSIVDCWFRKYNSTTTSSNIMYTNATNGLANNWCTPVDTDIPAGREMPFVLYDNVTGKYYMFVNNAGSNYDEYLYNSTNKLNWTVMNGGNPVLRHGTTTYTYRCYNPGVAAVNSSYWPMLIEGTSSSLSGFHLSYCYSNLSELNWTAHLSPDRISPNGGNPDLKYVPERNALLSIYGNSSKTYWELDSMYAYLDQNLSDPKSWNITNKTMLNHTNIHDTDPSILFTDYNKTHNMILSFCYNQNVLYQYYADYNLTTFFDAMKTNVINTSNSATWNTNGTPAMYNGIMNCSKNNEIISKASFDNTHALTVKTTYMSASTSSVIQFVDNGTGAMPRTYGYSLYGNWPTSNYINALLNGASGFTMGVNGNSPHKFDMLRSGTQCQMLVDDTSKGTLTSGNSGNMYIQAFGDGANTSAAPMSLDYIAVRKYLPYDPVIFTGDVETLGAPVANFTSNTTSGGVPLSVQFNDTSINSPTSWAWDFDNDGDTDSNTQNSTYTYNSPGHYTVKLTVSNGVYTDSEIKTDYINVIGPQTAEEWFWYIISFRWW